MAHLTATEARGITQKAITNNSFEVLEVLKKVSEAAAQGKRTYTSDWTLVASQEAYLRELGYDVMYLGNYPTSQTRPTICW